MSDTYFALLDTYHQASRRGENTILTLETQDNVETVKLTVSRPAGVPADVIERREGTSWGIPVFSQPVWRTPARQGQAAWRRPPGTRAPGAWAPPTPPSTVRRKSPSQSKRDTRRNEERRTNWRGKKLLMGACKETGVEKREPVKKAKAWEILLEKPKSEVKPKLLRKPKLEKRQMKGFPEPTNTGVALAKDIQAGKKYPDKKDIIIKWTNPSSPDPESDTVHEDTTLHILTKPNRLFCGGISLGNSTETFTVLHRPDCWEGRDPCNSWPGWEEPSDIDYDKAVCYFSQTDNRLHTNFLFMLQSEEGNTLTFDWDKFLCECSGYVGWTNNDLDKLENRINQLS